MASEAEKLHWIQEGTWSGIAPRPFNLCPQPRKNTLFPIVDILVKGRLSEPPNQNYLPNPRLIVTL